MPATRPRASFDPIPPDFDIKALVESMPHFNYVDRINCSLIEKQGMAAFERMVLLRVIIGGKPLVIDGFNEHLDPCTFSPKWLRDNCGDKQEMSQNLTAKAALPLTITHYLNNMGMLTNQFFDKPGAYKEPKRQRVYLKDIDCPDVWQSTLRDIIPSALFYQNESTGDVGGPGAVPDPTGRRRGKGIARAGDLMSSLPQEMRAENLMCYIGHEGTYTPAHREMCASLGQNIMVEASGTVSEDGKAEQPGSSIWFMTESKDRHLVSEYWLSVLGHDIEVEGHFAQIVAWKKAPFNVSVVEQRPGDFILIPPLAPHQVWNRGTRTMKVAWNRTTVETLEMAINEALPRSRIVCRDEQYKNKAIIYYTLQKYSSLLTLAQNQAARMPPDAAQQHLYSGKIRALIRDFRRLFNLYRQILLSEMLNPDDRDNPKSMEYLPFDGNVTCAYCRGNIFNRFLTCSSCKDVLGHHAADADGDPYDVCMDCYAIGRSCQCISNFKWVEQFRWKELTAKYESWRTLIIALDGGRMTDKTPLPLAEEKQRYGKNTLAEVCKEQLKRRPWKDPRKSAKAPPSDEEGEDEEIIVNDSGKVKKVRKKKSKAWLKNNTTCHVCNNRHPNWKMAQCTTCDRAFCYGSLFRGWDKMPIEIMEDPDWDCPHCLEICFAGGCRREGKMKPYEPKGTLLGHDTRLIADERSVEALVNFSVSNLNWLREDGSVNQAESKRIKRAKAEAQKAKEMDPNVEAGEEEVEETQVMMEHKQEHMEQPPQGQAAIDPALVGSAPVDDAREPADSDDKRLAAKLRQVNSTLPAPGATVVGAPIHDEAPEGYAPADCVPAETNMYPLPDAIAGAYAYPSSVPPQSLELNYDNEHDGPRPFKRPHAQVSLEDDDGEISMTKHARYKKPKLNTAGSRSSDLAGSSATLSRASNEAQRQSEKEKERKVLEQAKSEGHFIIRQAALQGKSRVVRLQMPAERLRAIAIQQAAKAALNASEREDADHGLDEVYEEPDDDDPSVLLESDIPQKEPQDARTVYQQRQKTGLFTSSKSKKALVPVEKNEKFRLPRAAHRDRTGGAPVKDISNDRPSRTRKAN